MKLPACLLSFGAATALAAAAELQMLDAARYHLRSGTNAEWEEFAASRPHGARLDISFPARRNATGHTLFVWQDDVKQDWRVELNGRRLGSLFLMEEPLTFALSIPAGALRDGGNNISIIPSLENDDIRLGELRLAALPIAAALHECSAEVHVTDADSGEPLPCRITVSDRRGSLAALSVPTNQLAAVRPGVVYTADGHANIQLLAGAS